MRGGTFSLLSALLHYVMNVAGFAEVKILELVGQRLHLHFLHLAKLKHLRLERSARRRLCVGPREVLAGVDQEVSLLKR